MLIRRIVALVLRRVKKLQNNRQHFLFTSNNKDDAIVYLNLDKLLIQFFLL